MSDNKQLWDSGWQAGFDWAYANAEISVNYYEEGNRKIYGGSISGGWKESGQDVMDRGDMFQRGYREGLLSGHGKYWTDNKESILKKHGIIDGTLAPSLNSD